VNGDTEKQVREPNGSRGHSSPWLSSEQLMCNNNAKDDQWSFFDAFS